MTDEKEVTIETALDEIEILLNDSKDKGWKDMPLRRKMAWVLLRIIFSTYLRNPDEQMTDIIQKRIFWVLQNLSAKTS